MIIGKTQQYRTDKKKSNWICDEHETFTMLVKILNRLLVLILGRQLYTIFVDFKISLSCANQIYLPKQSHTYFLH